MSYSVSKQNIVDIAKNIEDLSVNLQHVLSDLMQGDFLEITSDLVKKTQLLVFSIGELHASNQFKTQTQQNQSVQLVQTQPTQTSNYRYSFRDSLGRFARKT